jgi:hypothetical protein
MFVDDVAWRQPGDESREDEESRGYHSEIVDLSQPEEKVRN